MVNLGHKTTTEASPATTTPPASTIEAGVTPTANLSADLPETPPPTRNVIDTRTLPRPGDAELPRPWFPEREVSAEAQEEIDALVESLLDEPEIQALIHEFNTAVQASGQNIRAAAEQQLQYKIINTIRAKIGRPDISPTPPRPKFIVRTETGKPYHPIPPYGDRFPISPIRPGDPRFPTPEPGLMDPGRDPLRAADVGLEQTAPVNETTVYTPPREPDPETIIAPPLPENVRGMIEQIAAKVASTLDQSKYREQLISILKEISETEAEGLIDRLKSGVARGVGQENEPPPPSWEYSPPWRPSPEDIERIIEGIKAKSRRGGPGVPDLFGGTPGGEFPRNVPASEQLTPPE